MSSRRVAIASIAVLCSVAWISVTRSTEAQAASPGIKAREQKAASEYWVAGMARHKAKDWAGAVAMWSRAYLLDPKPQYLWALARDEHRAGMWDAAEEHYQAFIARKDVPPEVQRKMASLYAKALQYLADISKARAARQAAATLTNSIWMEFVLIPAGSFQMGSGPNIEGANKDERPAHWVTISKPFYLGKTEVTQEQWVAVMGWNPSKFKGWSNPVEQVSWEDVQTFIGRLNQKEGKAVYRLPTEAEWEYACRAGSQGLYSFGNDARRLGRYGWFDGNSGGMSHPVGQLKPNAWGLYDMHGNVSEWVQDWYGKKYYGASPPTDPLGPSSGSYRVWRGGSWNFNAVNARAASRLYSAPVYRLGFLGFRLARTAP